MVFLFRITLLLLALEASVLDAFIISPRPSAARRPAVELIRDTDDYTTTITTRSQFLFATKRESTSEDDNENEESGPSNRRRDLFRSAAAMAAVSGSSPAAVSSPSNAATTTTTAAASGLLVDLPMIRLKLPGNGLGEDYVAVRLCLPGQEDQEPLEFMLDTGLTLEMVTPHLQQQLGLKGQRTGLRGLAAGGESSASGSDLVTISGASLCDPASRQLLPLQDLHATVQDFPQEHIDPKHDPVEGMLGQEILSQYDVELDFPAGRVRLYQPGSAAKSARGMVEIPAVVINETGLLGFRLRTGQNQPVIAFIDCGSTFSAVNRQAAGYLGLPTNLNDPAYRKGPSIMAVGIDGRPMQLPTIKTPFTFAGSAKTDTQGRLVGFEEPPSTWKPWKPVSVAVGDLPVFPELLGDGVHPYNGPAALIGLDVLAQRRIIIESAGPQARTRQRRLFVSPA